MPQVIFSPSALRDLEQLHEFLRPKNPAAARRAAAAISKTIQLLAQQPHIGRPSAIMADTLADPCRELMIEFGDSGYIALYRLDGETPVILAIRHQKESGY